MANTQNNYPSFSGELATPIVLPKRPLGLLDLDEQQRQITIHKREKLIQLFTHYGVEPSDVDCWKKLAICLARDFVPGLQLARDVHSQAGAPKKWVRERLSQLAADVDECLRENNKHRTIKAAAAFAIKKYPERWGKFQASSLKTKYHMAKKLDEAEGAYAALICAGRPQD